MTTQCEALDTNTTALTPHTNCTTVQIRLNDTIIAASISLPPNPKGIIIIAGASSNEDESVMSPRVTSLLNEAGFGTLVASPSTRDECKTNAHTGEVCGGIDLFERRVVGITDWVAMQEQLRTLPVGYLSESIGAESSLVAATKRPGVIRAMVAWNARLERIESHIAGLSSAALFVVSGESPDFVSRQRSRMCQVPPSTIRELQELVTKSAPTAEPPDMQVGLLARGWFEKHLRRSDSGGQFGFREATVSDSERSSRPCRASVIP